MKRIAQIFVLIFIVFLLTPTVVSLLEKVGKTSIVYDFSDEENSRKEGKEFKAIFSFDLLFEWYPIFFNSSSFILSKIFLKKDNLPLAIFIAPPDKLDTM